MGSRRWRGRVKAPRGTRRDLWAGFSPNGAGETKPHHYREIARTVWENRRSLPYAWRILNRGVCDGCALGAAGLHDWTINGVHLCTTRLNLLKLNTAGPLDPDVLGDVPTLRRMNGRELRDLGRLPYPMQRRRGDSGFERITWDTALDTVAARVRSTAPERIAFYLTARGITNEVYYVAQKVARFLGTPNIDNAARICHAPSTGVLKRALGVGATTVSYTDVINSDLIVLFGADVANAQPVFMKYLYLARKRGTKVAVVNPVREPGLERYWVPSNAESAVFGTRMTDEFFGVHTGGDVAFVNGVIKVMLSRGALDQNFINDHTHGFDELLAELESESFDDLEEASGATRGDMERFADLYGQARSCVLVWSMGITQHEHGSDQVTSIVDLALTRGNVGRPGAGLMPIRGHSGVQGGAEMGAYATALPGAVPVDEASAAALSRQYGFEVPAREGLDAEQMVEGAARGDLDVLYSSGGNFLEALPAPEVVESALSRVPLRVHQDIVVSSQMLVDPGEEVILLPAATRYEQRGGGTQTTTERRVVFSPEIRGPRIAEARSEWEIYLDLAARVDPDRAHLVSFDSADAVRDEIARVVPSYDGVQNTSRTGDAVQWGGERLCDGGDFPTPDGRARFVAVSPPPSRNDGRFRLSTRRGKQFNTMVEAERDPLTGASRDAVLIAESDAEELGVGHGDPVTLTSDIGAMDATVHVAEIRPRNVQVFFPEGNALIPAGRRDGSGVPDYNTLVEITPARGRQKAGRST
ncbi:MAG: FdhF/YdeP family oxidoreductase [Acidimicrobiia bacterium]